MNGEIFTSDLLFWHFCFFHFSFLCFLLLLDSVFPFFFVLQTIIEALFDLLKLCRQLLLIVFFLTEEEKKLELLFFFCVCLFCSPRASI